MNENENEIKFAEGSVPVAVAARVYGKEAIWVRSKEILDTLNNPLYIDNIRTDKQGRRSQRLIGSKSTVNVNPDNGVITTVWRTGKRARKKFSKE